MEVRFSSRCRAAVGQKPTLPLPGTSRPVSNVADPAQAVVGAPPNRFPFNLPLPPQHSIYEEDSDYASDKCSG